MVFALILSVILSLEADFVQTKNVAMLNEPQVSTGHLSYRAPDYIRWAYTSPQTLVWEVNGEQSNVNPLHEHHHGRTDRCRATRGDGGEKRRYNDY